MSKVSIILPTYNGAKYIKRAIDSVLSQSFYDWELLVIDDGSTDNTEGLIKEYIKKDHRVIYLKNEKNLGIQKTLNSGLRLAKGRYIAHIDDDDIWIDKDKLKKQVNFLDKNPEYVLVGTGVVNIDENGCEYFRYLFPEKNNEIKRKILFKNCFAHTSTLFIKNDKYRYSENEEYRHIEDYELWLRMGTEGGKFYNIPSHSIMYTVRPGSITSSNKITQLKKNIKLINYYNQYYNMYYLALFFSYSKIFLYVIFEKLPQKLKNFVLKKYKEY